MENAEPVTDFRISDKKAMDKGLKAAVEHDRSERAASKTGASN